MSVVRDQISASGASRNSEGWAVWFWGAFLPDWLARVQDAKGGVHDALDNAGQPLALADKTLLTQSRTLFTLSHLALLSGDRRLVDASRRQAAFLQRLWSEALTRMFYHLALALTEGARAGLWPGLSRPDNSR